MSVARKFESDKIKLCRTSNHVEEIVQQDKKNYRKLPKVNKATFNYFLRKANPD